MATMDVTRPDTGNASGVLTIGFGTAVAMWAVGYVGRLPAVLMASPMLLALLVACLVGGGMVAGRYTADGWRAGLLAGLITGLLNLLVLGSLVTGDSPNELVPSALLWVPGSVVLSALLTAAGALAGSRWTAGRRVVDSWSSVFVRVAVGATMLLLAVGGLVTSKEAGLAVVDWPNSYGYNMFLYPLSRMTGGIYYEHAHRLFGALVGLTTLVMAVQLSRVDTRGWVRRLGWIACGMVVVQGVLGGLRVTGRFTLTMSPEEVAPNLGLAVVHGVFGQLFLGTLVALAAFTSRTWREERPATVRPGAGTDRVLAASLVGLLIVQLVLGAVLRHTSALMPLHIAGACLVAPLAIHVGFRTWGLNPGEPLLKKLGLWLAAVTLLQVTLGIAAFAFIGGGSGEPLSPTLDVIFTTAHQWSGAVLLTLAVLTLGWTYRLLRSR